MDLGCSWKKRSAGDKSPGLQGSADSSAPHGDPQPLPQRPHINSAVGDGCLPFLSLLTFGHKSASPNKSTPVSLKELLDVASRLGGTQQLNGLWTATFWEYIGLQSLHPAAPHCLLTIGLLLARTVDARWGFCPQIALCGVFPIFSTSCRVSGLSGR